MGDAVGAWRRARPRIVAEIQRRFQVGFHVGRHAILSEITGEIIYLWKEVAERVGFEFKASNLAFSALDIGYAAFVPPALPPKEVDASE